MVICKTLNGTLANSAIPDQTPDLGLHCLLTSEEGEVKQNSLNPASIHWKSIAGRYRPVSYPDGPITARYRFIKNAYWEVQDRFPDLHAEIVDSPVLSVLWLNRLFNSFIPPDYILKYSITSMARTWMIRTHFSIPTKFFQ